MRDDSDMTARATAPYGSWPSPISAADVARARLRLSYPTIHGDQVWWQETRPERGGRTTIVRSGTELLPAPWDARTRGHEYGGGPLPPPPPGGPGFSHHAPPPPPPPPPGPAPPPAPPPPPPPRPRRGGPLTAPP